jgi:hypothetical protein
MEHLSSFFNDMKAALKGRSIKVDHQLNLVIILIRNERQSDSPAVAPTLLFNKSEGDEPSNKFEKKETDLTQASTSFKENTVEVH